MPDLRFTLTRSQWLGHLISTTFLLLASAALGLLAFHARGTGDAGNLAALAVALGLPGLILACLAVPYSRALTECTPAGLRTRGIAGIREYPWPDISEICTRRFKQAHTIKIRLASGGRFTLRVPCHRPLAMGDGAFFAKADQIIDYWEQHRRLQPAQPSDLQHRISRK